MKVYKISNDYLVCIFFSQNQRLELKPVFDMLSLARFYTEMNYKYVIGEMTLIKYLEIYEDTINISPHHKLPFSKCYTIPFEQGEEVRGRRPRWEQWERDVAG